MWIFFRSKSTGHPVRGPPADEDSIPVGAGVIGSVKTGEGRRVRAGAGGAASIGAGAGVGATAEKRGVENPGRKNRGAEPGYANRVTTEVDCAADAEPAAKGSALFVAPVSGADGGGAGETVRLGELLSVAG